MPRWGQEDTRKLFERGLIMKSIKYPKGFEITAKGRAFLAELEGKA
jgi:predicted transcriptional regulator